MFNLFAISLFCQSVSFTGVIYEHNSKTNTGSLKGLANSQVTIPYSVPVISDNKGSFKTETEGFKVGESTKIKIRKSGYEIVNEKELNDVVVGKQNDIIVYMAPEGKLYEEKLKYYNLAKKSIELSHDEKMNNLLLEFKKKQTEYSNDNLSLLKYNEEYAKQVDKLDNEMRDALRSAKSLSKRVAEINLDFANNLLKRAVQLYKRGEIDSCLNFLNSSAFDKEQQRSIKKLEKMKEAVSDEGRILDVIIEKDFFKARIYQSQLKTDSVSSICSRIHKLSVKYFDAFGGDRFLDINKKIINMSSLRSFEWIDQYFYEDLESVVRLKKGRNSYAVAEVNRLYGLYNLHQLNTKESLSQLEKALMIHRGNQSKDTLLVLFNLVHHGIKFEDSSYLYGKNIGDNDIQFFINPYKFSYYFDDPQEILYASNVFSDLFYALSRTPEAAGVLNNIIKFVQSRKYRINYTDEELATLWIKYLKYDTETQGGRVNVLLRNKLFELNSIIDHRSIKYIDYLENLSFILVDSKLTNSEWHDKTFNSHLQQINNDIDKAVQFFDYLPSSEKFRLYMAKTAINLLVTELSYSGPLTESSKIILANNLNPALKVFVSLPEGEFRRYIKMMINLLIRIYGCDLYEGVFVDTFLNRAELYKKNNLYVGQEIKRKILYKACKCTNSEWRKKNDIRPFVDSLMLTYLEKDDFLIPVKKTKKMYGVGTDKFINQSSSLYNDGISQYYTHSLFFGSEYVLKGGKEGIVKNIDDVSYNVIDTLDYEVLWERYNSLKDIPEGEEERDRVIETFYSKSPTHYLKFNSSVSRIQTYNEHNEQTVRDIKKLPTSISAFWYLQHGNGSLDYLNELLYYLMLQYNNTGNYNRNLKMFKMYIDGEFDIFDTGRAINENVSSMIYLPFNYFIGIKSALLVNDLKNYEYFKNNLDEVFSYLSSEQKIGFINNYLWFSYKYNSCANCGNKMYYLFDDELSNSLFTELQSKLALADKSNDTKIELYLDSYLTLSVLSHLESFDYGIFEELKKMYPNEARVYRNEALYWLRKKKIKQAIGLIQKAIDLGFTDLNFFLNDKSIEKFHKKIRPIFAE